MALIKPHQLTGRKTPTYLLTHRLNFHWYITSIVLIFVTSFSWFRPSYCCCFSFCLAHKDHSQATVDVGGWSLYNAGLLQWWVLLLLGVVPCQHHWQVCQRHPHLCHLFQAGGELGNNSKLILAKFHLEGGFTGKFPLREYGCTSKIWFRECEWNWQNFI